MIDKEGLGAHRIGADEARRAGERVLGETDQPRAPATWRTGATCRIALVTSSAVRNWAHRRACRRRVA